MTMKLPIFSKDDSAENSIMQTITVAVSAILVSAGMITIPNIVNNGRDDRVRADLVSIGLAEDFQASNTGTYIGDTSVLRSTGGTQINLAGSTWTKITLDSPTGYGVLGVSQSGNVFVINASLDKAIIVGSVKFNGEGAGKTIKPASFVAHTGSNATYVADQMIQSGFEAADVYTAQRNN